MIYYQIVIILLSIIEDTQKSIEKPLKELFDYKFFGGNLYIMGFVLNLNQLTF